MLFHLIFILQFSFIIPLQERDLPSKIPLTSTNSIKVKTILVLKKQVNQAISHLVEGDYSLLKNLIEDNNGKSNEIALLTRSALKNLEPQRREEAIECLGSSKTYVFIPILAYMAEDREVGNSAIKFLYHNYTSKHIAKSGPKVRAALVRSFVNDYYSTYATLLLSYFSYEKSIIPLLNGRRVTYSNNSSFTPQIVTSDICLLVMGDKNSYIRVKEYFSKRNVAKLLFLFLYIKPVNQKQILLSVVDLLKDKGNARMIRFPGKDPTYTRMCDEAMIALQEKFNPSIAESYGPPRRFTDAELLAAYNKYSTLLTAKV